MTRRITTEIFGWIDEAIEAHMNGSEVRWEGQFSLTPDGPIIATYFSLPGAVLGTVIQSTPILAEIFNVTREQIDAYVNETIEALFRGRSEQLSMADAEAGAGGS